ncbi:MAG: response regulator, partial [Gemmatimonadota bacterium]
EIEADQTFTLTPYVYETLWFRALVGLGILALAWAGYRLRVRRLENRQRELLALTTEQKRTERALRESRERLQLALDSGRMGTWEWDVTTGRLSLDQATERMLGVTAHHIDDAILRIRDRVSPDDHARLAELPSRVRGGASSVDVDFSVHGTDSGPRHVELRGQTFLDEHGRPQRVMGVVADISELMDTQSALRLREEELRHAQKMEAVGRLAGGVAHDFNNLLTTILGRTQFLQESVEEAEAREDLEEIQKSAERAANLTQQLLTFSRKQVLQPRKVELDALIADLERMLRRLLREDVILETRLAPDLPAIHADPGSMEQVLVNLVVNAQDAMPQGGRLCIETSLGTPDLAPSPEIADGPFVVLTVSDTGEGMTEETLKHAFDPFFTTKPIGKGTGLGLATVYGIVQQCEGDVRVDTEIGEGTTFRIYLPAAHVPAASALDDDGHTSPDPHEPVGGLSVDGPPGTPDRGEDAAPAGRILLVEDDDSVRPLMQKVLTRHGYEVVHAASGAEALEICRREGDAFDLLLSDVVMPGMNGRELAEAVRAIRPDVAVLLVSGHHEDEILKRGIDEHETAFLRKPFDAPSLIEAVAELLARRDTGDR